MPIFDRLVGLETEYALRYQPADSSALELTRFGLYQALVDVVRRRVLTVRAKHFKEGVFTANGGAIWFEAERPAAGGGLIEGATPECRGPRQVVLYQRAQDQLLSESAQVASVGGSFRLLKNDRDSQGNVYGAQENYEVTIAHGGRLLLWRVGLVLLLPVVVLTWLGFLVMLLTMFFYLAVAGLVYVPLQFWTRHPRAIALALFGRDLVEGRETGGPTPPWLESVLLWWTRVVTAPLALGLWLLAWTCAFSHLRRQLLPLLVSRSVLGGSGMLDEQGAFHLADKAPAINCVLGYGGFLHDRPIFTMGHFFKTLCVEACFSPPDYLELFAARQRLQIGLGDSNMAEMAEYLRVGTTLLVLDAIEAGQMPKVPRLVHPIGALHKIAADPTLTAEVVQWQGRCWTAVDIQRFYLDACRRFVESSQEAPAEAYYLLERWQEVLDALEQFSGSQTPPPALLGAVDWITKQYLLEQAGAEASWPERKKIDLRYHELSPDGYFQLLCSAGIAPRLVTDSQIERAIRTPPPDSPATTRGHYIREFAEDGPSLTVNWKSVVIGPGLGGKTIRLSRYGRRAADRSGSPSSGQPGSDLDDQARI